MGLKTKFNLVMLAAFLIGLALAGAFSHTLLQSQARDEVLQQARLMIAEASAVRGYTDKDVGPILATQTRVRFLPQTIPFFAAQTVFRSLPATYHDYAYKEAALNPMNPADRAADWQADIINEFKDNPQLSELVNEREMADGPMLDLARPLRVSSQECLSCHSSPQTAPPLMIDLYGTSHGFGWKLGETVGAQIVSVPMNVAFAKANRLYTLYMLGLAGIFLMMLALLNLMLHFLIVRPIRGIAEVAGEVSLGNLDIPEYSVRGSDEIASLALAFNRMRRSVENAMRLLDGQGEA